MNNKNSNNKSVIKLSITSLLLAFSIILGYIEYLVPLNYSLPGIKLGLANSAIIFALFAVGFKHSFFINVLRVFIVSMLFNNILTLTFSLSGAIISLLVMQVLKHYKFNIISISIAGGVMHNLTQLFVFYIVSGVFELYYYLPVLMFSGVFAGLLIGLISKRILKILYNGKDIYDCVY